jgi:RES domain-containing protein
MKLVSLIERTVYRMHVPKWAVAPTSGAGAARHGGRVNRPGIEAIYLATEPETALQEYQQVSTLLPPGTLISYQLSIDRVIDFTGGFIASVWAPIWQDFYCDWRELWFNQRIEPPSWVIGDIALSLGAKGILFPSRLKAGGTNLVLFSHMLEEPDKFEVFDPHKSLPRSQASWD